MSFTDLANHPEWHDEHGGVERQAVVQAGDAEFHGRTYQSLQYPDPSSYYPQVPLYPQVEPELVLPSDTERVAEPHVYHVSRVAYPLQSAPHIPIDNQQPWSPYSRTYEPVKQETSPYNTQLYHNTSSELLPGLYTAASGTLPPHETWPTPYASMEPPSPSSPMDASPSTKSASTSSGKRALTCDVPGCTSRTTFTRAADLNRHMTTIHAEKRFHCDYSRSCGRSFSRRDHLTEHLRSFHNVDIKKRPPGEPRVPLPVGEGSIKADDESEQGLASDRSPTVYAHACSQCSKSFVRAGDLRKHEKVHMASKDREHRCDVCLRAFLYPKDLERHKRTQHPSEDTPAFFCPVQGCSRAHSGKPFYRKDKLQEHARKIHGQRLDELERRENG